MAQERRPTDEIRRCGIAMLRALREDDRSPEDLPRLCGSSPRTVRRAREWLVSQGARLQFGGRSRQWQLVDKSFALPLLDPTEDDLVAVLTAAGLLDALGHARAGERAWAIFDEIAVELTARKSKRAVERSALTVSQTAPIVRDPRWLPLLLRAVKRDVVRVEYHSPWKNERIVHIFEPWQVGLHDGSLYVCGFSRERAGRRTFNLAHIWSLTLVPSERPRQAVPAAPWGDRDPRFGIDHDRPGVATLRFKGDVARWVAGVRWQQDQRDTWIEDREVLERTLAFRSQRELARRLMGVADGLVGVAPPSLDHELRELLVAAHRAADDRQGRGALQTSRAGEPGMPVSPGPKKARKDVRGAIGFASLRKSPPSSPIKPSPRAKPTRRRS